MSLETDEFTTSSKLYITNDVEFRVIDSKLYILKHENNGDVGEFNA